MKVTVPETEKYILFKVHLSPGVLIAPGDLGHWKVQGERVAKWS